ncbi:MAG: hypothetical protein JXA00_03525 [Candidatus Thermoplasmatota archaeon]|nr:hypothetical protein [Candidatus Thermoplasmatota archaeon]
MTYHRAKTYGGRGNSPYRYRTYGGKKTRHYVNKTLVPWTKYHKPIRST